MSLEQIFKGNIRLSIKKAILNRHKGQLNVSSSADRVRPGNHILLHVSTAECVLELLYVLVKLSAEQFNNNRNFHLSIYNDQCSNICFK